jgi:hypothetical protein
MKFLINGYWKDDNAEDDDEIFYFGLNEYDIKETIKDKEDNILEFVITSYTKLKS